MSIVKLVLGRAGTYTAGLARRRRWWLGLLAAGIVGGGAYALLTMFGHGPSSLRAQGPRPPERGVTVVATPAAARDVGVYLTGLGMVTPLNTVTVHTRVDGQLMSVRFAEGQFVDKGDLLAEIDSSPFEAQLTQFQGQLARDQALLENARLDLERFRVLWAQDSIPKQQLDTQESLVRQNEGTVKNDQGLIASTRVQLAYCRITSPISGRVGLRLVDAGNIVQTTDATGIVVITQLQPITVVFTIPEDSIPSVLDRLNRGVRLPVEAYDREQRRKLATGTLLTIDNQVDPTTGTVKLKALFANADRQLFPSQFVNAHLLLEVKRGATVVPAAAIQRSTRGPFVYVVKPGGTVGVRPVTVDVTEGDDVAIGAGLTVGEQVVVDGADRLRDGSKVDLVPRNAS
jgi:multidrug efflux system membrane fusion protein